jgi:undecaprenyl diphosphate synthase
MVANSLRPTDEAAVPRHVAIIMDGNGRWAEQRGLPRSAGHEGGVEPVRATVKAAAEVGVQTLTLFAFSSENFNRPAAEVERLMTLFVESLEREVEELHANGVRVRFIGERAELGPLLAGAMAATEARTGANQGLELIIAVAYGGRWDLVQAARRLASAAQSGRLDPAQIDDSVFAGALATAGLPPIDLLVRTGGEQRISNFMLWDLAYSELYFTERLWPEFDRKEFELALDYFASRQRRFGMIGRQIGMSAC